MNRIQKRRTRSILLAVACLAGSRVDSFCSVPTMRRRRTDHPSSRRSVPMLSKIPKTVDEPVMVAEPLNGPSTVVDDSLESPVDAELTTPLGSSSPVPGISEELLGFLVLSTVPACWGTYVPVVRALYEIDPPIPGFVFSTAYFAVASASAFSLLSLQNGKQKQDNASSAVTKEQKPCSSVIAGAELGFYLFLGNSLQVIGLKTVPSDRAGFLVQLTTILVPLVQATLSGSLGSVPARTWTACLMALSGIAVMGYDGGTVSPVTLSLPAFTSGDALILGAAVVYSLHVVRLGRWANETAPLKLVAFKATTELILGAVGLYFLVSISTGSIANSADGFAFLQESGREIVTFLDVLQERIAAGTLPASTVQKAVGATVWTGLVSTAYTTYAQSYGQRRVKPADANLIYSLQPLFTAAFAYVLLGETMGQWGIVGGLLIGGAVYLAASQSFAPTAGEDIGAKS